MTSERLLVLFARAPEAQAREKGLPPDPASDLFAAMGREWRRLARGIGARIAIAAPPEDLPAWRRSKAGAPDVVWIVQRGSSFGERLEGVAKEAAALATHVVVTGGDVVPSERTLVEAFHSLESGAAAVLAPAPDGGVSLVSLPRDPDLLRSIERRRRGVFHYLRHRLLSRARRLAVVEALPDVDGRRGLRALEVPIGLRLLVCLVRRACRPLHSEQRSAPRRSAPASRSRPSRAPPVAA